MCETVLKAWSQCSSKECEDFLVLYAAVYGRWIMIGKMQQKVAQNPSTMTTLGSASCVESRQSKYYPTARSSAIGEPYLIS